MRGSPIRKSSDQRSVDSSPRLIAASYVLHRLLVPRHPPCALNNLATQKSHHTTPGRKRCGGPTRTPKIRVRRCSRPLCSSQRTTRHRPPDPTRPVDPHRRHGGMRCRPALQRQQPRPRGITRSQDGPLPQDPTACLPPPPRTDPAPHPPPTKRGAGRTRGRHEPAAELVSVPPSSTTPGARDPPQMTDRRDLSAALHHRTPTGTAARCSLERR